VPRGDDLRLLPREVVDAATVQENGEVWWPLAHAKAAVNALADAGLVILGLDLREYDDEGRFFEIAWSDYTPTGPGDAEGGRQAAISALSRPDLFGNAVLITWQSR